MTFYNLTRMKRVIAVTAALILCLGVIALTSSCTKKSEAPGSASPASNDVKATTSGKAALYRCSMHPAVTSDKPGDICPICHMNLEKVEDDDAHPAADATQASDPKKERKILFYRHPMRPDITSKTPAKDEMGMDYVPVYEEEVRREGGTSNVVGRASFTLSQERQQNIGVTTTKVTVQPLSYEVRASGRVAFDPDLYQAVEEYRQALLSRAQMSDGLMKAQADKLLSSSKTKLRLMGLADEQIHKLSSDENSPMSLLLPKGAVWVYAEVFEYEVAGLKPGLVVEAGAPSIPGKVFSGKVSSISPVVNSPTRTVRLRALVPDPAGLMRPDTFVGVKIKIDLGEKLAVPESAVLFSGDQKFVFVVKENGRFEPHAIRTGLKAQNNYEVLSGLQPGDTVVTSANFLIDSESRLRGVLESATQPDSAAPAAPSHSGHPK